MTSTTITSQARTLWTTTVLTNGQIATILGVRPQQVSTAVKSLRDSNAPRGQKVNSTKSKVTQPKVDVNNDVVAVDEVDENVFNVMSSYNNGNVVTNHYVFLFQGKWSCDCKAGQMAMNCKHVRAIFR